jgi:tripartite-type tricarboxylate transporter receptor subunit TctC
MLSSLAQIQIEHVSYKGPAPAHQDLLAGHVSMMCDAISNLTGRIASGQIRGIVVAAPARHPAVPNLPSAVEAGLPGLEMSFFVGFAAPKATPGTVVARLNREMVASLRTPEVAKRIESLGVTLVGDTPDQFNALIAAELKRYRDVVAAAGAVAE